MKKRLTAWALLFITVFVGMSVCIPSYAADNTKQYNPKAVAVVYDNSGSMIAASDRRQGYAEYALQSLVSLLNPQDALAVVPMTANGAKRYLDVDLSSANRQAAVDGALAFASQNYSHTTPGSSVADGVKVLTDAYGMVRQDDLTAPETDAYDYWLIVL
ncbi:MAG: hypothetical protein MJ078_05690, partial [Clostridia bacterium]|nr:hypothetical protein [Clostridia bacterium]